MPLALYRYPGQFKSLLCPKSSTDLVDYPRPFLHVLCPPRSLLRTSTALCLCVCILGMVERVQTALSDRRADRSPSKGISPSQYSIAIWPSLTQVRLLEALR
jgi:hypothetical protein